MSTARSIRQFAACADLETRDESGHDDLLADDGDDMRVYAARGGEPASDGDGSRVGQDRSHSPPGKCALAGRQAAQIPTADLQWGNQTQVHRPSQEISHDSVHLNALVPGSRDQIPGEGGGPNGCADGTRHRGNPARGTIRRPDWLRSEARRLVGSGNRSRNAGALCVLGGVLGRRNALRELQRNQPNLQSCGGLGEVAEETSFGVRRATERG